uniref:Uncharacterized protein n=1 Tax=Vespula pensylvanica TaxID=30213 RepID=A0A834P6S2_VESPE|nr:hypothetical protein H0235_005959 [Vespula pensylvanica]
MLSAISSTQLQGVYIRFDRLKTDNEEAIRFLCSMRKEDITMGNPLTRNPQSRTSCNQPYYQPTTDLLNYE